MPLEKCIQEVSHQTHQNPDENVQKSVLWIANPWHYDRIGMSANSRPMARAQKRKTELLSTNPVKLTSVFGNVPIGEFGVCSVLTNTLPRETRSW